MTVVSITPQAVFRPNDHRVDTPPLYSNNRYLLYPYNNRVDVEIKLHDLTALFISLTAYSITALIHLNEFEILKHMVPRTKIVSTFF